MFPYIHQIPMIPLKLLMFKIYLLFQSYYFFLLLFIIVLKWHKTNLLVNISLVSNNELPKMVNISDQ